MVIVEEHDNTVYHREGVNFRTKDYVLEIMDGDGKVIAAHQSWKSVSYEGDYSSSEDAAKAAFVEATVKAGG